MTKFVIFFTLFKKNLKNHSIIQKKILSFIKKKIINLNLLKNEIKFIHEHIVMKKINIRSHLTIF